MQDDYKCKCLLLSLRYRANTTNGPEQVHKCCWRHEREQEKDKFTSEGDIKPKNQSPMIPDPENSSVSSARAALGGYHRGTGLTWVSTVPTLCTGCHHLGYSISLQATFAWVYTARCILTSVRLLYKQLQRSTLGTRTVTLPIKLEVGSRSIDKLLVVNVLGLYLYYSDLQ